MRYPILSAGLLTTAAFVAFLATRPSAPDSITRSAPSSLAQALPAASSAPAAGCTAPRPLRHRPLPRPAVRIRPSRPARTRRGRIRLARVFPGLRGLPAR